jgi:hypothetical protein
MNPRRQLQSMSSTRYHLRPAFTFDIVADFLYRLLYQLPAHITMSSYRNETFLCFRT